MSNRPLNKGLVDLQEGSEFVVKFCKIKRARGEVDITLPSGGKIPSSSLGGRT